RNSPEDSRSAITTPAISAPSRGSSLRNAGMAIGRGRRFASSTVTRVCPKTFGAKVMPAPSTPICSAARRVTPQFCFFPVISQAPVKLSLPATAARELLLSSHHPLRVGGDHHVVPASDIELLRKIIRFALHQSPDRAVGSIGEQRSVSRIDDTGRRLKVAVGTQAHLHLHDDTVDAVESAIDVPAAAHGTLHHHAEQRSLARGELAIGSFRRASNWPARLRLGGGRLRRTGNRAAIRHLVEQRCDAIGIELLLLFRLLLLP